MCLRGEKRRERERVGGVKLKNKKGSVSKLFVMGKKKADRLLLHKPVGGFFSVFLSFFLFFRRKDTKSCADIRAR